MILVGIILSIIKIPNTLNKRSETKSEITENDETVTEDNGNSVEESSPSEEYVELTYGTFFRNLECLVLLVSACFSVVFTLYIDCILAVHLHAVYGVGNNYIGLFFLLSSITYVLGAPLSSWLSTKIHRRYVIFISFALMIV